MEIQFVYSKKRSDFGQHCNFYDRQAEIHCDIPSDNDISSKFISRNPVEAETQCNPQMAQHECNTAMVELEVRGQNHTEGGWPKDINFHEMDQVMRYRKRMEKEESYSSCLSNLAKRMEQVIKQNNIFDIYTDDLLSPTNHVTSSPRKPIEILNLFRAPVNHGQKPTSLSWFPDSPKKIAVAFADFEGQHRSVLPPNMGGTVASHVWDVDNSNTPEFTIKPRQPLLCLEYNPKDSHILAGGQRDGLIALFDTRKGSGACLSNNPETGHRDAVRGLIWIASKTGNECFSTSADGKVMWWDSRKLFDPVERMNLNPMEGKQQSTNEGALCLEYEPSLPMRFMVGTEQGHVMACTRKSKGMPGKVATVYSSHMGSVRAVHRHPIFPKNFMSVGDWTVKVWAEDLKESSIWCSEFDTSYLTDGCWSPSRSGVIYTTKSNGMLDVWDVTVKQGGPMFQTALSSQPIRCLCIHEGGRFLLVGSDDGVTTLLEVNESLCRAEKSEKSVMSSILERETKRERLLEMRHKESRNRETARSTQISRLSCTNTNNDPAGEAASKAKNLFLEMVEVERRRGLLVEDGEVVQRSKSVEAV